MRTLVLLIWTVLTGALRAELVTYPGPPCQQASDWYRVRLAQAGKSRDCFVYKVLAQHEPQLGDQSVIVDRNDDS